jgi:DNA/RNA endonuclease G (NUC1)
VKEIDVKNVEDLLYQLDGIHICALIVIIFGTIFKFLINIYDKKLNMKKIILLFVLLLASIVIFSQTLDKIIITKSYTSYFSYQTHTPLFVIYKLYKGGGDCSRVGMTFKPDLTINTATNVDYIGSGFDIGHMANAEDFAYDCSLEESTFQFINALPQTARLNRGIWKTYETSIRKQSQSDSLLIICGGYSFKNHLISNFKLKDKNIQKTTQVLVPDFCFKIVKNLKTKQINCYIFPNDDSDTYKEIQIIDLYKLLKYKVDDIQIAVK